MINDQLMNTCLNACVHESTQNIHVHSWPASCTRNPCTSTTQYNLQAAAAAQKNLQGMSPSCPSFKFIIRSKHGPTTALRFKACLERQMFSKTDL